MSINRAYTSKDPAVLLSMVDDMHKIYGSDTSAMLEELTQGRIGTAPRDIKALGVITNPVIREQVAKTLVDTDITKYITSSKSIENRAAQAQKEINDSDEMAFLRSMNGGDAEALSNSSDISAALTRVYMGAKKDGKSDREAKDAALQGIRSSYTVFKSTGKTLSLPKDDTLDIRRINPILDAVEDTSSPSFDRLINSKGINLHEKQRKAYADTGRWVPIKGGVELWNTGSDGFKPISFNVKGKEIPLRFTFAEVQSVFDPTKDYTVRQKRVEELNKKTQELNKKTQEFDDQIRTQFQNYIQHTGNFR